MIIEIQGGRLPFFWNGGMGLGINIEAPELGTSGFLPATEDERFFLGKDRVGCFFKEYAAVVVTHFANSHQVVC